MSPLLREAEEAGIKGLKRKNNPANFQPEDFFREVDLTRDLFSRLIGMNSPEQVTVSPSAAYALANIAKNIPTDGKSEILICDDQFPSNYYIWKRLAEQKDLDLIQVRRPTESHRWTEALLSRINLATAVVSIPILHWGDGQLFDLEAIREKTKKYNCLFVLDGTQSIGALPFDQKKIEVDALVVSAYKWLLGPYNLAVTFYGEKFNAGVPIEEHWLNRYRSENFQYLTEYEENYRSGARRYEMGEAADFIKIPMLNVGLKQLLNWTPVAIQNYCQSIVEPILEPLALRGFSHPRKDLMAYHLFGIRVPRDVKIEQAQEALNSENIKVSFRKDVIRISPYLYNTAQDLENLALCLSKL